MKTYINTDLLNEDYIYTYENDAIIVHNNCENNQCNCLAVYPNLDYMRSNTYSCTLQNNNIIDYNILTDDIYYRIDFYKVLIIFLVLCFIIIYCPIKIFLRFFKRFN